MGSIKKSVRCGRENGNLFLFRHSNRWPRNILGLKIKFERKRRVVRESGFLAEKTLLNVM